ncbi:Group 4 capsule polysaccharide lipoprotein gfcB, YjbF [Salipiger abyssi]|uniref:Group 4 capsule polysaccharide lipoprotein gfcB, YjbF n=2 Tax=Salipiger abyssi TaxID=1250539 RepID=A0A1P8UTD1_9RHOB|nr:Group 4 capsule polysaccharide lipoprotein gfcB, YjbF [Salipiger abyssi]
MKTRAMQRFAALLGLGLALAGCSNDPYFSNPVTNIYSVVFGGDQAPSDVTQQQIVQTLTATDLPVAFFNVASRNSQTLLIQIEQNAPYRTFATATRQAVVMNHGMITGTRGLGGDLMSTDESAVLELVRGRQTGQVTYVQRFLTAEDITKTITYRCGVEPDKAVDVNMGLVQASGQEMVAACESPDGPSFVDYYVVDASGEILASRQWLGEVTGYAAMHMLRR